MCTLNSCSTNVVNIGPKAVRHPQGGLRVWELVQGKRNDWDYIHELVTSGQTAYDIVSLVPSKQMRPRRSGHPLRRVPGSSSPPRAQTCRDIERCTHTYTHISIYIYIYVYIYIYICHRYIYIYIM